jgi:hypothetical protein
LPSQKSQTKITSSKVTMSNDMSDSDVKEGTNPFEDSIDTGSTSFDDDEMMSKLTMTGAEEESPSPTESQVASHILQRGALISGVVPLQEEHSPPTGSGNDLESGVNPPDSDYASRTPKSLWAPSVGDQSISPPDSDYASRAPQSLWAPIVGDNSLQSPSNDSALSKRSKSYRNIGLGCMSLMLIGAIIAVAIIAAGGGGGDGSRVESSVNTGGNGGESNTGSNGGVIDTGNDSGGVDTETETEVEDPFSEEAQLTDRQQLMHDIIMGVSGDEALQNTASPQSQARKWLLFEDILWLSPISSFTSERIIQRYALATFYFSTDGPNSWKDNNWMKGDECKGDFWDGISCNENNEIRAIAFGKSRREILSNISNLYTFANTTNYSLTCDR